MRIQWICLTLLLTCMTFSSSGCLALVVGAGAAGTVAYVAGDVESEEPYNLDEVYAATKKAAQDLKLYVIAGEGGRDALSATVVARDAADKRITIKLKATTVQTTKISIRVGTFGSETKSRLVYNRIRDNLRAVAPASSAAQAQTPPPADAAPVPAPAQSTSSPPAAESTPPDPQAPQADVQAPLQPTASAPAAPATAAPPAPQ